MRGWIAGVLIAAPLLAQAIEPGPSSRAQAATEAWLRVQAKGEQASTIKQTATPKEREQSMQRWLDAYKYQLPEVYRWERVESDK